MPPTVLSTGPYLTQFVVVFHRTMDCGSIARPTQGEGLGGVSGSQQSRLELPHASADVSLCVFICFTRRPGRDHRVGRKFQCIFGFVRNHRAVPWRSRGRGSCSRPPLRHPASRAPASVSGRHLVASDTPLGPLPPGHSLWGSVCSSVLLISIGSFPVFR